MDNLALFYAELLRIHDINIVLVLM